MNQCPVIPMNEIINNTIMENTMDEYQIAFIIGGSLSLFMVAALVLSWVAQWVWAWIDDRDRVGENWFYNLFTKTYTVKGKNTEYKYIVLGRYGGWYSKRKEHHGKDVDDLSSEELEGLKNSREITQDKEKKRELYCTFLLVALFTPITLLILFKIYPVTLAVISVALTAYLARFARRNQKLFLAHVKDVNAHKEEE